MSDGFSITDLVTGQRGTQGAQRHLVDAMFPAGSVQDALLIHGAGFCPINTALVDTTTVHGAALVAQDHDPFLTDHFDRLGRGG